MKFIILYETERMILSLPKSHIVQLIKRHPALRDCKTVIQQAQEILLDCVRQHNKILLCGNGGSCADCEHISGELLKGFLFMRPLTEMDRKLFDGLPGGSGLADRLQYGIPAVPLTSLTAAFTAFCNDVDPKAAYAQMVYALGRPGDVLVCISTSGNAENVCNAAVTAKAIGMSVIGLTGDTGGKLSKLCDCCIKVPETETYRVQELHLPVYHCLCASLEEALFN